MSDVNLISRYETSNGQIESFYCIGREARLPDWDDSLKLTSRIRGYTASVGTLYGGREDCVDIHNGASHITVISKEWRPQGKYLATIKGGVKHVHLSGDVYSHGTEVDVDIGNRSTVNREKSGGVHLSLASKTGKPITVRVLNGEKPTFEQGTGPYKFVFPHPDAWYHGIVVWLFKLWK